MKKYRALISVPITADDDSNAWKQAVGVAHSLRHRGSNVVAGHLELLGEVAEGERVRIDRVVNMDPDLADQVPPDLARREIDD